MRRTGLLLAGAGVRLVGLGLCACGWRSAGRCAALHVLLQPAHLVDVARGDGRAAAVRRWLARGVARPGRSMPSVAALLAAIFVYCQGRMLQAAKGIPAWREPLLVPLIVATGLAEGGGLLLLLAESGAATARPLGAVRRSRCSRVRWRGVSGAAASAAARAGTALRSIARAVVCKAWHGAAAGARRARLVASLPADAVRVLQLAGGALAVAGRRVVQVHADHAGRVQPGLRAGAVAGARRRR